MATNKNTTSIALFFALNLIFFSLVSACGDACPKPPPKPQPSCPVNTLKFGVCANVLAGLIGIIVGHPPVKPCCSLIDGLVDLEAAVCLCTAIKAGVLGAKLNIPLSLSLLINACGKETPPGYSCA